MAMVSSANRRAVSSKESERAAETVLATWTHAPGGWLVLLPRLQYWNVADLAASGMAALPSSFTSAKAAA